MAPLFSKVDLNKLWHDVQNEETLICAKYGKDLFNISKVIGRKKVAQFFFDSQCRTTFSTVKYYTSVGNRVHSDFVLPLGNAFVSSLCCIFISTKSSKITVK